MTAKISASADGLKVTIGNAAEDALEIDQTAKTIKGINGYVVEAPLPPRTWQAFTVPGQRALGTTYTNNTGQDLIVRVRLSQPNVNTTLQCTINGNVMLGSTILTTSAGADQWTVPPGATYQPNLAVGATGTVTWFEFRE